MEVTDYTDDFAICGKAPAAAMRAAVERMMERLRLPLNAMKTCCLRLPAEPLEFLGHRIGRNHNLRTVLAFISTPEAGECLGAGQAGIHAHARELDILIIPKVPRVAFSEGCRIGIWRRCARESRSVAGVRNVALPADGDVKTGDARYEGEATRLLSALRRPTKEHVATREPSDSPRPLGRLGVTDPLSPRNNNVRQRPRT